MTRFILQATMTASLAALFTIPAVAHDLPKLPLPKLTQTPLAPVPQVVPAFPAPVTAVRAVAEDQYQVEYRHSQQTNNEWRVALAWTTDLIYANSVYSNLVKKEIYDVRMYKRTRQ